ncbi:MAG: nucleotide exchange factor GrpE [Solirubrobacteraceae bacterium]
MSTGGFAGAPFGGGVPEREPAAHADAPDGAAKTSPATAAGAAGAAAAYAAAAAAASAFASSVPDPAEPERAQADDRELSGDPETEFEEIEEVVTATPTQPAADERVVLDIEELSARADRADEYLELAQRVRADFENYRRRAVREAAAAQERGVAKLARELLHAIDNLDRAVQAAQSLAAAADQTETDLDSQLISGIKLVHADVLAALARVGIEQFSPEGEQFDPTYHEAVAQAPIEGAASGSVVEVYQRGYRIGENVLRPARVLVAA